jgi:hypothetical protein
MAQFAYTIFCELPSEQVAADWVEWLTTGGHMKQIKEKGATDAYLIQHEPLKYEARYIFPSREAFEVYEKEHAPALREDGIRKFPPELGLKYQRTTGTVVYQEK